MENLAVLIGKRIRQVRISKGLRQEDIGQLGIAYKYFQKIENGKANVTLKTLEKIADALEINPTALFELPLSGSSQITQLASAVSTIIKKNDEDSAKKLNIFINEILD